MGKKKRRQRTAEEIRNINKSGGGAYWKRQPKNKGWDSMSFEEREAERLKKKKERVYTKSFSTQQTFGPASEVRIIDPKEYKNETE